MGISATTYSVALVLVLSPLLASPDLVAAQDRPSNGEPMRPGLAACTAILGGPPPAMVLRHRDDLELDAAQVDSLEAMRDRMEAELTPRFQRVRDAHERALTHLQGDQPDFERFEEDLLSAAREMVDAHVEMARMSVESRALLTDGQLDRLDEMSAGANGMRMPQRGGAMRGDGMHGEAMMRHGSGSGMMGCMMGGGAGPFSTASTSSPGS